VMKLSWTRKVTCEVKYHSAIERLSDLNRSLIVVGRMKDLIIRGGENLFPVQIENTLTSLSSIAEAAAVSVPDPKYGEVVGAWISRKPGTKATRDEIREWVSSKMNPQVSFFFVLRMILGLKINDVECTRLDLVPE
jgi:acyl-CoA synthetase (AMP-forming)/AMP-acid ligase II